MRTEPVLQRQRIRVLQAAALFALLLLPLLHPAIEGIGHEFVELTGLALAFVCVAGRIWSILYVGAKKNLELATTGPYSMTRNPLYFFSTIGAVGIGLMFGSVLLALGLGSIAYAVLRVTAAKEADYLQAIFGSEYEAYARRTPAFWPNISLYEDRQEVVFSPKALRRTMIDALPFLAVFPIIETIEYLQETGTLPVLFWLF